MRIPSWKRLLALSLLGCALAAGAAPADDRVVLRVDRVTLDPPLASPVAVTRVNFRRSYGQVPLVFVLPTEDNPDPAAVRIVDVDTTGFEVALVEPPGEDGSTSGTTLDYFAVEPFARRTLGVEFEAGRLLTSTTQGRNGGPQGWETVSFARTKNSDPIVLVQVQSANNEPGLAPGTPSSPWLTAVVDDVTAGGFDVALERSETSGTLAAPEEIAWFAMDGDLAFSFFDENGSAVAGATARDATTVVGHDNGCTAVPFGTTFPGLPRVFAGKLTRNGGDGGWLRRCGRSPADVGLLVDEDRAEDSERSHTREAVGVLAFERSFVAERVWPLFFFTPFDGEVDSVLLPSASGAVGRFTDVVFPEPFATTPLVFALPTEGENDPAALRIRDVTPSGFRVAAVEPPGEDGPHGSTTVDYLAVEPGAHRLDDGRHLEAGFLDTTRFVSNGAGSTGWERVSFTAGRFATPPALLAGLQTVANEPDIDPSVPSRPFLTAASQALDASGVDLALERSEVTEGAVTVPERIGWLAADRAVRGTLVDRSGATVAYDFSAGATVEGFDDGCDAVSFTAPFAAPALVVADKNARNGNNGGWLRRCAPPTAATVGLHVDEDRAADPERTHIAEPVSVLAFGRPFAWSPSSPEIELEETVVTVEDPVSGASQPKAIPGALVEHRVVARNRDKAVADPESLVVTALRAPGTELFLGDLDGTGAPVRFLDGAVPSGLALDFGGLDDPADGVEFTADDGASWDYQPTPGQDFDPQVDGLRVRPTGTFRGVRGGDVPSFELRWRARVE
ncbi:MAG: hypothetical protein V2J02_11940 [Pseudomonadales bacterium]|jgi:hypothetical protein|nr:hypothetical protein [Pseudomonadales bacterium]